VIPRYTPSIRARLTLWYTSLLLAIMLTVSALAYAGLRAALLHDADTSLLTVATAIADTSVEGVDARWDATPDDVLRELVGSELYDKFFRLVDVRGRAQSRSSGHAADALALSDAAARNATRGARTFETVETPDRGSVRVLTLPIVRGGRVVQLVQVGLDLSRTHRLLRSFTHTLLLLVPLGAALAAAGGFAIAARALRPLDDISRTARRITAEDLGQRIPPRGTGDELDRLAETLNVMLARLDAAFTYLRRFAADAAHELRTPLTALKGGLEVALRAERSPASYRAVLASSLDDVEALVKLAEDLLLFSRATAGLPGPRSRVELEPLVLDVAETGARLAKGTDVTVRVDRLEAAAVVGDAAALRRALLNVVENAIHYTGAGGTVRLGLGREPHSVCLSVDDDGPGIAPSDAERIFEPFVRLPSSRERHAGGSGLGLAIARSIAAAHDGSLTVSSTPGAGARFTFRVPVAT
jgi:heavy metal sensor kinase